MAMLMSRSAPFRKRLMDLKTAHPPDDFSWYGYEIFGNLHFLDELAARDRNLLDDIPGGTIADIGAADGDLAFFLESEGYEVDIIDHAPTNWNGLRGAQRMKEILESGVTIHDLNLDQQFHMPRERYDLVLFLGILYHVKNPFYILETLARHTRYMYLSTRIARFTADELQIRHAPLAYLLAPDECNNDPTNYWIFSREGLLRLLDRCGWNVRVFMTVGDTRHSTPSDPDRDERAFVTLESRYI